MRQGSSVGVEGIVTKEPSMGITRCPLVGAGDGALLQSCGGMMLPCRGNPSPLHGRRASESLRGCLTEEMLFYYL